MSYLKKEKKKKGNMNYCFQLKKNICYHYYRVFSIFNWHTTDERVTNWLTFLLLHGKQMMTIKKCTILRSKVIAYLIFKIYNLLVHVKGLNK